MNKHSIQALLVTIGLTCSVNAWAAQDMVGESTDPAMAAAVEKTAQDMKERATQSATSGLPVSSANIVRGKSDEGLAYLSGGITLGDRATMYAERAEYSLWVATVAKVSGAYIPGAKLRIVAIGTQAAKLDRTMDGPWFFAALPPGQYDVAATVRPDDGSAPQTMTTRVNITKNGQRQVVLRFASSAEVAHEMQTSSTGNSFDPPSLAK
jgi:hypothetical protein